MVRGAHVLEIGAGVGAVGNALASIFGAHCYTTDLPHVLPLLQANADANSDGSAGTVEVRPLVWGQTAGEMFEQPWKLICAADVCYDAALIPPLGTTLRALLSAQPEASVLLALSDLHGGVSGTGRPNYFTLLHNELAGLKHEQIASLPGAELVERYGGDVLIADTHRTHQIDIFLIKGDNGAAANPFTDLLEHS